MKPFKSLTKARSIGIALFLLSLAATPALAHPHVWIDMKSDFAFNSNRQFDAITITWTFDEFYSAFAVSDFKKQSDGGYSQQDLSSLLKVNLDNLKDPQWHYFTEVQQSGKTIKFKDAVAVGSTYDTKLGRVTSTFKLILATPLTPSSKNPVQIRIYDPTFYIDIEYVKGDTPHLTGDNHTGCTLTNKIPDAESVWTHLPKSAFIGGDGSAAQGFGSYFATTTTLVCPDA